MPFAGRSDHHRTRVTIVTQRDYGPFEFVHVLERHPVPRGILTLKDHHWASMLDAQGGISHGVLLVNR
jgi:hypothetical protein